MVEDRESPSAGWREVSREMGVDTDVEEPIRTCPDCGRRCENVLRDVYECEEHGVFRASAENRDDSGGSGDSPSPADASADDSADARDHADGERDPSDETTDRATGRAD